MIIYLNGELVEKEPMRIVLDVGGVGYEVFISLTSYDKLPAPGNTIKIMIYDHIREDVHHLYGFMSSEERRMFLMLLMISGIGPKLALTVLSGLPVRDLKLAVVEGDVKRLSSISGIGKKTAERMVVELKDKLGKGEVLEAVAGGGEASPENALMRDAILALVSLGYKQVDAHKLVEKALNTLGEGATLEAIIRKSLAR